MAQGIDQFDPNNAELVFDPATATKVTAGGEFKRGVSSGIDNLQAAGYGLAGQAGAALGIEPLKKFGLEGYKRNTDEAGQNAPAVGRFEDINSLGDAGLYAAGGIGQLAPFAVGSIATGAAGRGIGKLAGGAAGANIGTAAGLAANSVGTESGLIYGDIYEKTGKSDPGTAAAYGVAAGALDLIPELGLVNKLAGRGVRESIAKAVGKQVASEAVTEAGQTVLERGAVQAVDPSQRVFTPEGISEIANAALLGGIGGGVVGGAGELASRATSKKKDEPTVDPIANQQAAQAAVQKETQRAADIADVTAAALAPDAGPLTKAVGLNAQATAAAAPVDIKQEFADLQKRATDEAKQQAGIDQSFADFERAVTQERMRREAAAAPRALPAPPRNDVIDGEFTDVTPRGPIIAGAPPPDPILPAPTSTDPAGEFRAGPDGVRKATYDESAQARQQRAEADTISGKPTGIKAPVMEVRDASGKPWNNIMKAKAELRKRPDAAEFEVKRLDKGQFVLARKTTEAPNAAQAQAPEVAPAQVPAASGSGRSADAQRSLGLALDGAGRSADAAAPAASGGKAPVLVGGQPESAPALTAPTVKESLTVQTEQPAQDQGGATPPVGAGSSQPTPAQTANPSETPNSSPNLDALDDEQVKQVYRELNLAGDKQPVADQREILKSEPAEEVAAAVAKVAPGIDAGSKAETPAVAGPKASESDPFAPAKPAKAKKQPKPLTASDFAERSRKGLLKEIRQMGGIDQKEMADITGEGRRSKDGKTHTKAGGQVRALFRKNGVGVDAIRERLAELGYFANEGDVTGDLDKVRDLIRAALDGNGEATIGPAERDAYESLLQDERIAADEAAAIHDLDEQEKQRAVLQYEANELLDEDTRMALAERYQDDEDYYNALQEAINAKREQEQGNGGSQDDEESGGRQAGGPAEGAAAFGLEAQTEADLKDKADRESADQAAEAKAASDAEAKAKADTEAKDFRLTGSNRAADVAMAGGQKGLFDASGQPAKTATAEPTAKTSQPAVDLPQTTEFQSGDWTYSITVDRYWKIPREKLAPEYQATYDTDLTWEASRWSEAKNVFAREKVPGDSVPIAVARKANAFLESVKSARAGDGLFDANSQSAQQKPAKSEAPEHQAVEQGVSAEDLKKLSAEFKAAQQRALDADEKITHVFDPPAKAEIVRLQDKVRVQVGDSGWMTTEQAKARIAEWKANAEAQGKTRANADKIVLSLFDLTGKWSQPWEEAGYQVYRFDIQDESVYDDPETGEQRKLGDINNMSVEYFNDLFGSFDGNDVHAILAACPCTDFASSGARHFAAKDADGRTVSSVKLVHQTLNVIEYFKPAVWAIENPVGRIEDLGGLPPWRLSFDPNHIGDPYTKKTLLWGRFNADLPIAPVEPTEGSKMHQKFGGKSLATKNARSATPEGFAYGFFQANNAIDNPVLAVANKYDRLDREAIKGALDAGLTPKQIDEVVEDFYYQDLDDEAANKALREAANTPPPKGREPSPAATPQEIQARPASQPITDAERDTLQRAVSEAQRAALADLNAGKAFGDAGITFERDGRFIKVIRDGLRIATTQGVAGRSKAAVTAALESNLGSGAQSAAPAPAPVLGSRRGKVGDKMAAGEVVTTASGRQTTPFPKIDFTTDRKAGATVKRVDQWLMENALTEAEARGDEFNARSFRANKDKPSQADKDSAEEYLFGSEQPPVIPSILKPLKSQSAPAAPAAAEKSPAKPKAGVQDYGEKLEGARKYRQPSLDKTLTDDDIRSQPLSKIWPVSEVEAIEDKFAAAVATAARAEVPTKPQKGYKLDRWVEKVKSVRSLASLLMDGTLTREKFAAEMKARPSLDGFAAKVRLFDMIDRSQWKRIGTVGEYQNAYRYEDGKQVPTAFVQVEIDGRTKQFAGKALADVLDNINSALATETESRMAFEVRGNTKTGVFFINKKGDSEYRPLKTFTDSKAALAYVRDNYTELVKAWDAVKERDNVGKADVRRDDNRPRTGADHRKGKDATVEQFAQTFGFRGVEFGNWVSQGGGAKDRQGLLNQAYDAMMDLAGIVGVPPRAMSLNGTLGLGFGSRGHGWASAHFESDTLVINLTKTRGAGTLAHEWFHALDNYFARQRGGEKPIQRGLNAQEAYRQNNYITYKPEPLYVHKDQRSSPLTRARLESLHKQAPQSKYYDPANWVKDPAHPQGVRTEVESRFAELVKALDESPMAARARMNDKGENGYWGRIIERGARSFENYVISKMAQKGYNNDYLANVVPPSDFKRNADRYPYLKPEEEAPIIEAFDNLFGAVQTKADDAGNVAMFRADEVESAADAYQNAVNESADANREVPASQGGSEPQAQRGDAGAQAGVSRFATETALVKQRSRSIGRGTVRSWQDAADALGGIASKAVENLEVIVTSKSGEVLAVVGNFKGERASASVYSSTLIGEIFGLDGAAAVWMVHNHPSGNENLSPADIRLSEKMAEALRGSSVEMKGIMAIGAGDSSRRWSAASPNGARDSGTVNSVDSSKKVPILERELTRSGKLAPAITDPASARRTIPEIAGTEAGIVFVDSQNTPIAFVPWSAERAGQLRGTGGLDALYEAAAKTNATAAFIANPNDAYTTAQIENLGSALQIGGSEVRVLDAISYSTQTREAVSLVERGMISFSRNAFLRASPDFTGEPNALKTHRDVRAALAEKFGETGIRNLMQSGVLTIVQSRAELPASLSALQKLDKVRIRGLYDPATDRAYIIANEVGTAEQAVTTLLHEVGEHFGLKKMLGERGYARLLNNVRSMKATNAAVAEAWAHVERNYKHLKPSDDRFVREVIAKLGERPDAVKLPFFRRLVLAIRQFLYKQGFLVGKLTDEDIVGMVVASAKRAMSAPLRQPGKAGPSDQSQQADMSAGEAPMFSMQDARAPEMVQTIQQRFGDVLDSRRTFNQWWHSTVGTQYHKAQVDADYRKVFNRSQEYLTDVSRLALAAADKAPEILPKFEGLGDLAKTGASPREMKAVADAVFRGTLSYVRDEATGEARPARDDERGGIVFNDGELKSLFGLNAKQVRLYRQSRAAIDRSLEDMTITEMVRLARADGGITDQQAREAVAAGTLEGAREVLAGAAPDLAKDLDARIGRARQLMAEGYAPLMRFGEYSLYVTGADGSQIYYGMFESAADRNKMEREMRAQHPEAKIETGVVAQQTMLQGMSLDTLELFANITGADKDEAFQTYLKTALSNRSALKRLIQRKGVEGFDPDLKRVLAQFVTSNARAGSKNLHAAELRKAAEAIPKDKGDVKDAATTLVKYLENPTDEAQGVRSLLFLNFIGGSIASAAVNMTQPLTMTFPYLSQWGASKAAKELTSGMKVALQSPEQIGDAGLRAAMQRAIKEGTVEPHQIYELQGAASTRGRDLGPVGDKASEFWTKAKLVWGRPFALAEQFNRRATFAAAYQVGRGLTPAQLEAANVADAYDFAVKAVNETQGIYNRGNRPDWARGAVGATIFTFKQYSIGYVEFLKRLPRKERLIAVGVLFLAAGLNGLPGADDLDDLIDTVMQSLGYSASSKEARNKALNTVLAPIIGQGGVEFVKTGISAFLPIDVQGRLGMANLIPGTGIGLKSNNDKAGEVFDAIGPAGGLAENIGTGIGKALSGDFRGAAAAAMPVAIQNAMKGASMAQYGFYRDEKGRRVIDTTAGDAFAKSLGFQPATVANESRIVRQEQQGIALNKNIETEIADQWAQGLFEKDREKVEKAMERLRSWNQDNPESRIRITPQQVAGRVKQMQMSRAQRFIKTAPKELRGQVAADLAAQ